MKALNVKLNNLSMAPSQNATGRGRPCVSVQWSARTPQLQIYAVTKLTTSFRRVAALWPELIKLAMFQHIIFIHLLDIFYLPSLCLGQMHLILVWGRLYFDLRRQSVNIRPFRVIRWFENYAPCVKQRRRSWRWADRWLTGGCRCLVTLKRFQAAFTAALVSTLPQSSSACWSFRILSGQFSDFLSACQSGKPC